MVDYTAYASTDLLVLSSRPLLIGYSDNDGNPVADGAAGTLTFTSTKAYQTPLAATPDLRMKPSVIVQFSPASDTFTLSEAVLEVFTFHLSNANVNTNLTGSATFVCGVEKYDLTRGIFGETDQLTKFPAALSAKTSAQPSGSLEDDDAYTRVWQVRDVGPGAVALGARVSVTFTNSSGGPIAPFLAAWIMGV